MSSASTQSSVDVPLAAGLFPVLTFSSFSARCPPGSLIGPGVGQTSSYLCARSRPVNTLHRIFDKIIQTDVQTGCLNPPLGAGIGFFNLFGEPSAHSLLIGGQSLLARPRGGQRLFHDSHAPLSVDHS